MKKVNFLNIETFGRKLVCCLMLSFFFTREELKYLMAWHVWMEYFPLRILSKVVL